MKPLTALPLLLLIAGAASAQESKPDNVYLFPAGGQRGTQVQVQVEGENVASVSDFHLRPTRGISAPRQTARKQVRLDLAPDAPLGLVPWRLATTNGGTGSRAFAVGDYPEVLEQEQGPNSTAAQPVTLPVTINGRVNPRADVDRFSFELKAGQRFYAEVMAARLGGPLDTNVFTGQFGNPPGDVTCKQLDASLAIYGPDGKLVARAEDTFGLDPAVGFRAPAAGRYTAQVHHLAHLGMPQFVYRLTLAPGALVEAAFPAGGRRGTSEAIAIVSPAYSPAGDGDGQLGDVTQKVQFPAGAAATLTTRVSLADGLSNVIPLRLGDHPELREGEPNDTPERANAAALPAVLNGRFLTPRDSDLYAVQLKKGENYRFDAYVERLGTPTDAELSLLDSTGKVVATNDDGVPGCHDPRLWFTPAADGDYLLQIRETGMSRLGERLVYRIEAQPQQPDFEVTAAAEALDLSLGASAEVAVNISRFGGLKGTITVTAEDLPTGVTAPALTLAENQGSGKLKLTAAAGIAPGSWPIRLVARTTTPAGELVRTAAVAVANAAEHAFGAAPRTVDDLLLTVRYKPPFTVEADDSYVFMNLGTVYPARVKITREPGFTGPITLSMADRQPRDPYGITFDTITVTDSREEVFIPMRLPQGPRGNPIVRTYIKAEAVVKDASGVERHVVLTSPKQVVIRTQAPVFSLEAETQVVRATPGSQVPVRFRLGRTAAVPADAEIRLLRPEGMQGVSMAPLSVGAGQSEAQGMLQLAPGATLGEESHLWFEAVTKRSDNGYTVFFRVPVELDLRTPKIHCETRLPLSV